MKYILCLSLFSVFLVILVSDGIAVAQPRTIYIDPSQENLAGDGSQNNPYDSWRGITFIPGNTYRQKRGTTYWGSISIKNISGSTSAKIALGVYGIGDKPKVVGRIPIKDDSWMFSSNNGVYSCVIYEPVNNFYASSDIDRDPIGDEITYDLDMQNNIPLDGKWGYNDQKQTIYYKPREGDSIPGHVNTKFFYGTPRVNMGIAVRNSSYVEISGFHVTGASVMGVFVTNDSSRIDIYNLLTDYNGNKSLAMNGGIPNKGIGNGIHIEGKSVNVFDCESAYNEDNGFSIENVKDTVKPANVMFYNGYSHHNNDAGATIRGSNVVSSINDVSHGEYHNCIIEKNGIEGEYGKHGIRVHSACGKLNRNTIRYNNGSGIRIFSDANSISLGISIKIENNLIYRNNVGNNDSYSREDAGIVVNNYGEGNKVIVTNNSIIHTGIAFHQYFVSSVLEFKNNIIKTFGKNVLWLNSNPKSNSIFNRNNYVVGPDSPSLITLGKKQHKLSSWNSLSFVGNDINSDPLFVDENNYNYRLRGISPMINEGIDIGLPTDIEGNTRIGIPDIGAYEYKQKLSPPLNFRITGASLK